MQAGGRAAAAIDVLTDIETRHRPAGEALKDWGLSHRFAGSGDRAAIGNIVYDALRAKSSLGWVMGGDTPRALVLAVLVREWGVDIETLKSQFAADRFAPDPPTDAECASLRDGSVKDAPDWVKADIPEWVWEVFSDGFEDDAVAEGIALVGRPPLDLRVNTLKATRDKALKALSVYTPEPARIARNGLRIATAPGGGRVPNVQADEAYRKGWVEVQDEGSQVVVELMFPAKGEKILDYCAGAGGKTLALSALLENTGQIFAYDRDKTRLAPIYDRLKRAGTRNVQVLGTNRKRLAELEGRMDRVLVDAPCTGSGTWRRRPETKWKLTPEMLEKRMGEQAAALDGAAPHARPGGFLCYVTCSVLPQENEVQVYAFLDRNPAFTLLSAGEVWEELYGTEGPKPWSSDGCTVTLTPASTGTDGFFFAVLQRNPD
ncbi:MAG: RsmB/NOP family class I SAM-dependent RNA methyltransferase [Rhodobiaceae bacterium]|nr:RsmB/NOP family class I SAM-dependent RNA methyltransferase [Rhodobiaceae bacterium]